MNNINHDCLEQILDGLDLTFMSQYLRKFAPWGFFPEGHPIDYDSLKMLDSIQRYVSDYKEYKTGLLFDYGDFLQFGWTLFCISIKNIEDDDLCVNYALLAYFSASLGVAHHPEAIEQCTFLRLQIMSWIANDILQILEEMYKNNEINITQDDAISMLFMSDIYSTESVKCEEKWCVKIRSKCKEFEPDYEDLTKDEIIDKGREVHQLLKIHIFEKLGQMKF